MMPENFYKEEVGRLRTQIITIERENHGLRAAISDFCERWDEGLGGDSKYMEELRSSLSVRSSSRPAIDRMENAMKDPATKPDRLKIASQILAGFASNPAVFAPNPSCGWALVNTTDKELIGYVRFLADTLIECMDETPSP